MPASRASRSVSLLPRKLSTVSLLRRHVQAPDSSCARLALMLSNSGCNQQDRRATGLHAPYTTRRLRCMSHSLTSMATVVAALVLLTASAAAQHPNPYRTITGLVQA